MPRLDEYESSDSDDDFTEREQILLKKVRDRGKDSSDSEKEVYSVGTDNDSESDDNSDIALSDVEGQDDDDNLPNSRAWGKDKKGYYWTDYVDQDYGGFQGKDAALAELEEEEARNLQRQLIQELDEEDFSLDLFAKKDTGETKEQTEEIIKTDISKLSQREKLQLLKKQSPEFFELVKDFKAKMEIVKSFLIPTINLGKNNKIKPCSALEFVTSYHSLILNYCSNICMYLFLKSSKVPVQHHPVIKRLFQYRQYVCQMDSVFEELIKPQIEMLLAIQQNNENGEQKTKPKTLKVLSKLTKKDNSKLALKPQKISKDEDKDGKDEQSMEWTITKTVKFANVSSDEAASEEDNKDVEEEVENQEGIVGDKRAITYQMAKNKGLMPHRKKEQRNPRVKHRNKYRKAKIRRKGAVREVRKELTRYGGELSGIKASVTKSIKLK